MTSEQTYDKIKQHMAEFDKEYSKFHNKGVKVCCSRARKHLIAVDRLSKQLRKELTTEKAQLPTKQKK